MAALCHNFTQNAWKKDLCSNCFKSKEEHNANGNVTAENKSRYLSTMYSSRAYSWRQKDTGLQSILKDGQQVRRTKTSAVHFAAEESEVIGYGGDECYSSDGEDGMDTTSDGTAGSDDEPEGEEERALQKLTRSNTCFNTVSSNLLGNPEGKPTYSQLMLGKPLTDAEGRKQTLLVSVTPFGSATDDGPNRKIQTTKLGEFLSERTVTKSAVKSVTTSQELVSKLSAANIDAVERKDKVGKVLPRQNSKDLLLKSLAKDDEEESTAEKSEAESSEIPKEKEVKPVQESEPQCEVTKVNKVENVPAEAQTKQDADVVENKVSRIPVIKNRLSPDKSKTTSRMAALSGKTEQSTKGDESPPKPVARKNYEFVKKVDTSKKESTNVVPKVDSNVKVENQMPSKSENECSAKNDDKKISNKVSESSASVDMKGAERKLSVSENTQQARPTATKVVQEKLKATTKPSNIVVETHNLEIRNTKKSTSIESKNFVNSLLESEKKPFSLKIYNIDSVCIDKCSTTVEGSYKKLSLDDEQLDIKPVEEVMVKKSKSVTEDTDVEMFRVEESRELAGEPDGRADPDDISEPPALPRSPPPVIDPRPSFLHTLTQAAALRKTDKPKIPAKPSSKVLQATPRKVMQKKEEEEATPVCSNDVPQTLEEPLQPEMPAESHSSMTLIEGKEAEQDTVLQQDIATLPELARAHKRQAPKPPTPTEDVAPAIHIPLKEEVTHVPSPCPESVSRRNVSLSAENLTADVPVPTSEKKSSHSRARFSLRKFLRLGGKSSSKEDRGAAGEAHKAEESLVSPRPRLEIIHPLDLNGTSVEVVHGDANNVRRSLEDSTSTSSGSSENKEGEILTDSSTSLTSNSPNNAARPNKPPPPPRNQSLDAWGKTLESLNKPARPPPPKSAELLRQQKQPTGRIQSTAPATSNLYANLALISGEVRSGLAPSKPQRSSSIRDANNDGPKRRAATDNQTEDSGYESVELSNGKPIIHNHEADLSENVYECVTSACSSSPECDSVDAIAIAKPARYAGQRRSEGSMDTSPDYLKFRGSFMRSTSLPYCGSETESDIYSPYSFYGSEDLQTGDDDSEWSVTSGHPWKISKLRLRKGRTIVHKNLEDNYGAVIVANHEALAQVLEQINAGVAVPPALRGLKAVTNLRWTDFILLDEARVVAVGKRAFHPALWGMHRVTLSVAPEQTSPSTLHCRGSLALSPVTEFTDLVPARYLPGQSRVNTQPTQAWVSVLPRMQVDTIQSFGLWLQAKGLPDEERYKDGSFVLLQLINGLKHLQAQGLEEASLSDFALWRREEWEQVAPPPRLCILGTGVISEGTTTLCQCALTALQDLLPSTAPLVPLLKDLLRQERAGSLSRVKAVLEFSLWGPADIALGTNRELVLQRWLDLERATVLHGLVRSRVELSAFEECHLLFLVRTSAKTMSEASLLLEKNIVNPETTTF